VIRILLAEQMSLLRGALAAVLSAEDDMEVAAEVSRVEEIVLMARAVKPDIAVVDIDMLANDGPQTIARLADEVPECVVVVLAGRCAPGALRKALDSQVNAFVDKNAAPAQFVLGVRRVVRGERVIDPALAVAILAAPPNPLTPRECEILQLAAGGLPTTEIAARLHLSKGTVRNHVSVIMRKTGARNRLHAVRIAQEAGWL
jgi:two-component system, NarL family, response regulator DesR